MHVSVFGGGALKLLSESFVKFVCRIVGFIRIKIITVSNVSL